MAKPSRPSPEPGRLESDRSAPPHLPIAGRAPIGATLDPAGCTFVVWAPAARSIEVHLLGPEEAWIPMAATGDGYHAAHVPGVRAGARYLFRIDGDRERPDPASRLQPEGVHAASEVVDSAFPWTDGPWRGLPLEELVIYELHVGTFTEQGTFAGVIAELDRLVELGITAIELMPLAEFPGARNWGYDGVYPFAVHHAYGGPRELKRLVDACHERGLAVLLDVVYNHLGPEGNYLWDYGPYFTKRYRTPWGEAVNLDGPDSDEVRQFFIENAVRWVDEFHFDGLRLDALHEVYDFSARPFLRELADTVHEHARRLGRPAHLIAECDLNDVRLVQPPSRGGYGLDAQWSDDFHHALHALLTGERHGYYQAFGGLPELGRAMRLGYGYTGQRSSFRRSRFGSDPSAEPPMRFVVFAQNHDQIGNRPLGERLSALVSPEQAELAAVAVILSPFLPLLFMGEEYGESSPFLYFTSHSDRALVDGVRRGRKREFVAFGAKGKPPDPQSEETFQRSRLDPSVLTADDDRGARARRMFALHRTLLRLWREHPVLAGRGGPVDVAAYEADEILVVRRWRGTAQIALILHFGAERRRVSLPLPEGRWRTLLDTAEGRAGAPAAPTAAGPERQERSQGHDGDDAATGTSRDGAGKLVIRGGEASLTLPRYSALLLEREGPAT